MIISCSAKALQRIKQARADRIGKDDARPTVADDKETVAAARRIIAADPSSARLVWNLDLETSPVVDGKGDVSGHLTVGYLHNAACRCTVVLNGLDDADLCRIAEVARRGIRTLFDDFNIPPGATEAHLERADVLDAEVRKGCGILPGGYRELLRPRALLVPNGDRAATASVNHAKALHRDILFGGGAPPALSSEPVDRTGCFYLNREYVKYKGGEYDAPLRRAREMALGSVRGERAPAVTLRLRLVDDGYLYRGGGGAGPSGVPEVYRDVVVPLSAPLSWLHQVIQRTMLWADYHLHAFRFLDFGAREMLEHAFKSIYGAWDWEERDAMERGERPYNAFESEGEAGFVRATRMDLRWLYHDFMGAMEREGVLEEDFPCERLPEDCPLGMLLLGSEGYRAALGMAERGGLEGQLDSQGLYYNYDFGDNWELSVVALGYSEEDLSELPRIVGAAGHTPPEDCGGIGGFEDFLAALESGDAVDSDGVDLEQWARGNGWQPFEGLDRLEGLFDRPSTWAR